MPPTTTPLQKCAVLLPQLLLMGILLALNTARADQLCGRQFDTLAQLYVDLRARLVRRESLGGSFWMEIGSAKLEPKREKKS